MSDDAIREMFRQGRARRIARLDLMAVTSLMVCGALAFGFVLGVIWSHL